MKNDNIIEEMLLKNLTFNLKFNLYGNEREILA